MGDGVWLFTGRQIGLYMDVYGAAFSVVVSFLLGWESNNCFGARQVATTVERAQARSGQAQNLSSYWTKATWRTLKVGVEMRFIVTPELPPQYWRATLA